MPSCSSMSGEELLGDGSGALDIALGSSCSVEGVRTRDYDRAEADGRNAVRDLLGIGSF